MARRTLQDRFAELAQEARLRAEDAQPKDLAATVVREHARAEAFDEAVALTDAYHTKVVTEMVNLLLRPPTKEEEAPASTAAGAPEGEGQSNREGGR